MVRDHGENDAHHHHRQQDAFDVLHMQNKTHNGQPYIMSVGRLQ